jgi:hypothetical protein
MYTWSMLYRQTPLQVIKLNASLSRNWIDWPGFLWWARISLVVDLSALSQGDSTGHVDVHHSDLLVHLAAPQ